MNLALLIWISIFVHVSSEAQIYKYDHLSQRNHKFNLRYSDTTCGALVEIDSYKLTVWEMI